MKKQTLQSEQQINIIRGKILCGAASKKEIEDYLFFVDTLEELVEEASMEDFYGTEGWKFRIGWGD